MAGIAVGVDAGGTSIVGMRSRDGADETMRSAPAAQPTLHGLDATVAALDAFVRTLCDGGEPERLFVASAGAGRSAVRDALEAALRERFSHARVAVEDDSRVALRAALPDGPGVVLIAGTGSVAYAENGALRVRTGGAGFLLGDEGSGFALGLAGARLLARVYDGRVAESALTRTLADALDARERDALLATVYAAPLDVARIASLAPAILMHAGEGERGAVKLVQEAAAALGELARSAVRAAGLADASPPIVFAGGLLRENSLLTFLLETRITNEIAGAAVVRLRDEPARAALRMAEALA